MSCLSHIRTGMLERYREDKKTGLLEPCTYCTSKVVIIKQIKYLGDETMNILYECLQCGHLYSTIKKVMR